MRNCRELVFCFVCIVGAGLPAADPAWKTKPAPQWTEDDARQVLNNSPWARAITAGLARRQSEDELRDGGQMGQPKGIGYDNVDPKGTGPKLPNKATDIFAPAPNGGRSIRSTVQGISLRLRWESALPVRLAELKSHEIDPPTLEVDGYKIAVYGIPGGNFKGDPKKLGDPLKEGAVLRREGKKDVRPARVEVFQGEQGVVVVYLFYISGKHNLRAFAGPRQYGLDFPWCEVLGFIDYIKTVRQAASPQVSKRFYLDQPRLYERIRSDFSSGAPAAF
jgi:hypothetical protein